MSSASKASVSPFVHTHTKSSVINPVDCANEVQIIAGLSNDGLCPSAYQDFQAIIKASDTSSGKLKLLKTVAFFLSNKIDVPFQAENRILEWLELRPNIRLLEHLLSSQGSTFEALAENLFQLAVKHRRAPIIKTLLNTGLNPNGHFKLYWGGNEVTALMYLCYNGDFELARMLVDAGADVNCVSKDSSRYDSTSPLMAAAVIGDVSIVEILLAAGANVNWMNRSGRTALFEALYSSRISSSKQFLVVKALVMAGACVSVSNGIGVPRHALEVAAKSCNMEIVQFLFGVGAELTLAAMELAADREDSKIFQFLLDRWLQSGKTLGAHVAAMSDFAKAGHMAIVSWLLSLGSVRKEESKFGRALVAAIRGRDITLVRITLEMGNKLGVQIRPGQKSWVSQLSTALGEAIRDNQTETAEVLLQQGAMADYISEDDESLLTRAILHERTGCIELLLVGGAHPNCCSGVEPLQAAVWMGQESLVRRLLKAGADVNAFGQDPDFHVSASPPLTIAINKAPGLIPILLEAGADINNNSGKEPGASALSAAYMKADFDLISHFLQLGASPDDSHALDAAVRSDCRLRGKRFTQHLLKCRDETRPPYQQSFGSDALATAIMFQHFELIDELLDYGVDPNTLCCPGVDLREISNTALYYAIRKYDATKNLAVVQKLLRAGADPSGIVEKVREDFDEDFEVLMETTALEAVISRVEDAEPLIQLLLDFGANVNQPAIGYVQRTPLQRACESGKYQISQFLLSHGADVNGTPAEDRGATALQFSAIRGDINLACLLLDHGADVNAAGAPIEGRTALEGAAEHGRIDMIQLLVNAGAQLDGPGKKQYENAKSLATENAHYAARRLLESFVTGQ